MSELTPRQAERKRTLRSRDAEVKLNVACRALLASPDGRVFLNWLFEVCGFLTNPFAADPLTNAFNAGRENVARFVYAHLGRVDPDGLINLLKENLANDRADDYIRAAGEPRDDDADDDDAEYS